MLEGIKRNRKIIIISICAALLLISSVLFTFKLFNVPSWNELFKLSGITDMDKEIDNYDLQVHFIDVGKADSILIKYKDKNILIDAGDMDSKNSVVQYMKRCGVKKLDLLVNTHPDKDHLGQMTNVVYEFDIDKFIFSSVPDSIKPTSYAYESLWFALSYKEVITKDVKSGDDLSIDDLSIKVIAPITKNEDNTNNNSIVLKMTYKDDSFLFMGDAQKEEEDEILDNKGDVAADLIKIGHHGSKTSTSKDFLNAVNPILAVISVGEDSNDLPKQETLQKLYEKGIEVYRTDLNQTVTAVSNGDGIKVFTQK